MTDTFTIAYATPYDHAVIASAREAIDRSLCLLREPYWPREWFRRPTEAELLERRAAGSPAEPGAPMHRS
jgi:hypothetical protein